MEKSHTEWCVCLFEDSRMRSLPEITTHVEDESSSEIRRTAFSGVKKKKVPHCTFGMLNPPGSGPERLTRNSSGASEVKHAG